MSQLIGGEKHTWAGGGLGMCVDGIGNPWDACGWADQCFER